MPTWKSVCWFIGSELIAQGAILWAAGIHSNVDFSTHPIPVVEMIVVFATGFVKWLGYSPLFSPLGAPEKP